MTGKKFIQILIFISLSSHIISGNIDYKQYDIDAQPVDLVWCGPTGTTVFIVTELSSLYTSEDRGFSWKKLNDILINTGKNELDENEEQVKFY
jgi:phosphoserine aminotransferase